MSAARSSTRSPPSGTRIELVRLLLPKQAKTGAQVKPDMLPVLIKRL